MLGVSIITPGLAPQKTWLDRLSCGLRAGAPGMDAVAGRGRRPGACGVDGKRSARLRGRTRYWPASDWPLIGGLVAAADRARASIENIANPAINQGQTGGDREKNRFSRVPPGFHDRAVLCPSPTVFVGRPAARLLSAPAAPSGGGKAVAGRHR